MDGPLRTANLQTSTTATSIVALVATVGLTSFATSGCPIKPLVPESERPIEQVVERRGNDNAEMAFVPAGTYLAGSTQGEVEFAYQLCEQFTPGECELNWFTSETPQREVELDGFWIDVHEVSNAQYHRCVEDGGCNPLNYADCRIWDAAKSKWSLVSPREIRTSFSAPDQPVVCAHWNEAATFCEWAGKRLPTEAEWEKAARGIDGRIFPWGKEVPSCDFANFANPEAGGEGCGRGTTVPVGSHSDYASPYGVEEMSGNVIEWVFDFESTDFYKRAPQRNPMNTEQSPTRVIRGGSWTSEPTILRAANRGGFSPAFRNVYTGFRCAMTDGGEPAAYPKTAGR